MSPIELAREAYLRRYRGVRPDDVRAGKYDWNGFIGGYAAAIEDARDSGSRAERQDAQRLGPEDGRAARSEAEGIAQLTPGESA